MGGRIVMSAIQREQLVNSYVAALVADINDSVTTLVASTVSGLPTSEDFRIIIDSEIMLVTAVDSDTNELTVEREVEGTTAASHSAGTYIHSIITAAALNQYMVDRVPLYGEGKGVGHMMDGSDNAIDLTDWTWVNQNSTEGDAVATEMDNGEIRLTCLTHTLGGPNLQGLVISAPSTPYSVSGRFSWSAWGDRDAVNQLPLAQMWFRESSTSKITAIFMRNDGDLAVYNYTDETTGYGWVKSYGRYVIWPQCFWFQLEDNGTNLYFKYSNTGYGWSTLISVSRTSFFTSGPNQVGFGMNARYSPSPTNDEWSMYLQHWSFE